MLATTIDVVMLGSSVLAGSCCVATPLGRYARARALAIAMPIAMALTVVGEVPVLAGILAMAMVFLSASLLTRPSAVNLHRALGGGLMSGFVLIHLGLMQKGSGVSTHHPGEPHAAVQHGMWTHLIVGFAALLAATFALWTVREVLRLPRGSIAAVVAVEFVSMAVSIGTMAAGIVLSLHSMHG